MICLISANALLNQRKRPKIDCIDGVEYIAATFDDLIKVINLMDTFKMTFLRLNSELQMRLLEYLREHYGEEFTVTQLMAVTKRSQKETRELLRGLVSEGYVTVNDSTRPFKYSFNEVPELAIEIDWDALVQEVREWAAFMGLPDEFVDKWYKPPVLGDVDEA